jgi:hypothetical protein
MKNNNWNGTMQVFVFYQAPGCTTAFEGINIGSVLNVTVDNNTIQIFRGWNTTNTTGR